MTSCIKAKDHKSDGQIKRLTKFHVWISVKKILIQRKLNISDNSIPNRFRNQNYNPKNHLNRPLNDYHTKLDIYKKILKCLNYKKKYHSGNTDDAINVKKLYFYKLEKIMYSNVAY